METISISKLKATGLAVLEQVRRTREPVLVTKFGQPVAEAKPPAEVGMKPWLGVMVGSAKTSGDIVAPASLQENWETLR